MSAGADGPVVIVMLTHRGPQLVNRIIGRVLKGTNVAVVVHHDPRGITLRLPRSPQLFRVPDPLEASWGRIGLARAVLHSLRFARRAVPELSWILIVSGQDYPCRSMTAIESELADSPYDAYLRWFMVGPPTADVLPWQAVARRRYLKRIRLPGTHRHVPFPRAHPFRSGLDLYIGDMWTNLTQAAVDHIEEQRARHPSIERYLARCQVPDEALLPTLLLNQSDSLEIANDRKRYIRWTPRSAHPETLTLKDAFQIRYSGDFFARKVEIASGSGLLDRLDEDTDMSWHS